MPEYHDPSVKPLEPGDTPVDAGPPLEEYRDAFNALCDALLDEAQTRDWCSEYDDFVANFNARPGSVRIPVRRTQCTISFVADLTPDEARTLEERIDRILSAMGTGPCADYEWS